MDPASLVLVIPDPSLVVLVGAAGAGKSSFAARHFAPDEVLSSDAFRARIAGDAGDQRATRPAFAALHRALASRMDAGLLTVVDATNVQLSARRQLVRRAALAGVPAVAIVLDLPIAVVLARNASRSGSALVPDAAVLAQHATVERTILAQPPEAWAGFAQVFRLTTPEEVERVVVRRRVAVTGTTPSSP
jgi:protein phosphatase